MNIYDLTFISNYTNWKKKGGCREIVNPTTVSAIDHMEYVDC